MTQRSLLFASLLLAACTGSESAEPPGVDIAPSVERADPADVPAADVEATVAATSRFAGDLLAVLPPNDDGDLVFSPWSITSALGQTWAGADGRTADELAQALHIELPAEQHHAAMNAVDLQLLDAEGIRLETVNQTFVQQDYPFEADWLETLAKFYGNRARALDFKGQPEAERGVINEWVAGVTEDRIPSILPEGAITDQTRFVVVNALFLLADWLVPFESGMTADKPFTLADGSEVQVPTMRSLEVPARYSEGLDWSAIRLRVEGRDVDVVFLLPDEGSFEDVRADFGPELIAETRQHEGGSVEIELPRFSLRSRYQLEDALEELGVEEAFGQNADFSRMSQGEDVVRVTKVIHEAVLEVDEQGVEGAAVTVVVGGDDDDVEDWQVFHADRPFLVGVVHAESDALLFVGEVQDPR